MHRRRVRILCVYFAQVSTALPLKLIKTATRLIRLNGNRALLFRSLPVIMALPAWSNTTLAAPVVVCAKPPAKLTREACDFLLTGFWFTTDATADTAPGSL